jgi:hypothetical protein
MRALRRLLSWVWTVLWVRWRLAGATKRRILRGRRRAGFAAGNALPVITLPVEGLDYDVEDVTPGLQARLDAYGAELLDVARATAVRRTRRGAGRRRRALSLATAGLVTLTVLGAAATALVTGSTGVPAVDRWLGIQEAGLERQAPGRLGPRGGDVRPTPSMPAASIRVRLGGSRTAVVTSYVARSGEVCSTLTDGGAGAGNISCVTPALLDARLRRDNGLVLGMVNDGRAVVLAGLVTADAERVSATGPTGPLEVQLGGTWEPDVPDGGTLKPFVAVEYRKAPIANPLDYRIHVETDDAKSFEIRP